MINCILLVLLLLVSMVLLKCTSSLPVMHFLNFVRLFHLQVLLVIIFLVSFVIFFRLLVSNDYGCKDTFSFVSQINNANLSKKFLVSNDVPSLFTNIPLQETVDIAMNFILDDNSNLNITKKELKKNFSFLLHHRIILFLTVSFIIKSME